MNKIKFTLFLSFISFQLFAQIPQDYYNVIENLTGTELITKLYTYTEQDTYTLQVKAKDIYNQESDWATLEITMPQNNIQKLWFKFFENHPILYNLIKLISIK